MCATYVIDPRSRGGRTMWMRSCALCKALLQKPRLWDSIRCQCGWEWQAAGEDRGKLITFPAPQKSLPESNRISRLLESPRRQPHLLTPLMLISITTGTWSLGRPHSRNDPTSTDFNLHTFRDKQVVDVKWLVLMAIKVIGRARFGFLLFSMMSVVRTS